jgi:hypothetical protein
VAAADRTFTARLNVRPPSESLFDNGGVNSIEPERFLFKDAVLDVSLCSAGVASGKRMV